MIFRSLLLLTLLATGFFCFTKITYAQVNLEIKPTNLQIRINQTPTDVIAPFTIKNRGSETVQLLVIFKRFRYLNESGALQYRHAPLNTDPTDRFLQRLTILNDGTPTPELTLGPQQEKRLELFFSFDEQMHALTSNQDQYFSIVLFNKSESPINMPDKEASYSTIRTGISIPVLLSVGSNTGKTGIIEDFSTNFFREKGPVPFNVLINNKGEHFINAKGVISIKNMFGQLVGQIELPSTAILAGTSRALASKDNLGTGKAIWKENFLLGWYTATLTLTTSPEESLYTRSVSFVSFPFIMILVLLLITLIGIFVFKRIKKKLAEL